MCGIVGFIDQNPNYDVEKVSKAMGDAIVHRGPDAFGSWNDHSSGVNLIHRRLSILDLSDAGKQPMFSVSGRYVLVFNGEVYNFNRIRNELEQKCGNIVWRGHSDTEVLLYGFEIWGIELTLQKCNGMFAIAVWDQKQQELYLIRDRIGEKPLYYGYSNGVFGFTSELKAFKQHPKFNLTIDKAAMGQYVLHNCIPAPLSIYTGIYKLIPGHIAKISLKQIKHQEQIKTTAYWQLQDTLHKPSYNGSRVSAASELEQILKEIVSEQIIADVPLGCFLSGGIDSSLIAAIMQQVSARQIKTFSIGFDNPEFDEAGFAKAVATHLGTEHSELYITDRDALNVVPLLPTIYDEPFADSSQIPTYLLCKMARRDVTVALSGDGGDEVFTGYQRYLKTYDFEKKIKSLPCIIQQGIKSTASILGKINYSSKLHRINSLLSRDYADYYMSFMYNNSLRQDTVLCDGRRQKSLWSINPLDSMDAIAYMQFADTMGYLPDDIMVKVDRAAMANSLETRAPLLNHRLVEFGFSLPESYKISDNKGKLILRDILYKYVPQELIERPKRGFTAPLDSWIKGELKEWVLDLLQPQKLIQQGFFNPATVKYMLDQHFSGNSAFKFDLWGILMFQQWMELH